MAVVFGTRDVTLIWACAHFGPCVVIKVIWVSIFPFLLSPYVRYPVARLLLRGCVIIQNPKQKNIPDKSASGNPVRSKGKFDFSYGQIGEHTGGGQLFEKANQRENISSIGGYKKRGRIFIKSQLHRRFGGK